MNYGNWNKKYNEIMDLKSVVDIKKRLPIKLSCKCIRLSCHPIFDAGLKTCGFELHSAYYSLRSRIFRGVEYRWRERTEKSKYQIDYTVCIHLLFLDRGSEALQKICHEKLCSFFDKNVVLWKRSSQQYSFSYHAHFLFEFVPFSNDTLINYKSTKPKTWEEASLLHFFFLNPSSVPEYRNEFRNEISEWFATVSKMEGAEWLIVFDSLKAREQKNRGALIERIKSDFAKFTNRIIEIYDPSNIVALQNSMQSHLLNSLEHYVTHEESSLSNRNDQYSDANFDFITFCRDQMSLSRLYQSLGMFEQVLALFDELDATLSLIALHHSSEGPIPKWLRSSKCFTLSSGCPLFVAMLKCDAPWDNITIVELRYIILAHQILNAIQIYEGRLKRISTVNDNSSQNLRTEFAVTLLRYSLHCLNAVFESLVVFKISLDRDEMQCWIVSFCLETMQLTSLLTEITHVEQAAHLTCSLKLASCQAMSRLNERWNLVDWKKIAEWFEDGIERCGVEAIKTSAIDEIRQIFNLQLLSDKQQFTHYMQKYHESSIALLKHFGWRREARSVGWELAKFLLSSDRTEGALPYLLNFISDLIADGSTILLLRDALLFTVNHLEKFPGIHFKELIDFYLILMQLEKTEEEQVKYCDKLLDLSEKSNITKIRLDSNCKQRKAFSFGCSSSFPFLMATPNETIKIDAKIISHLPKSLKNFKLHCCMKLFVQNESQKRTAGRRPHFECVHNEADCISRFSCVWKGDIEVPKGSILASSISSTDESEDCLIFRSSDADELKPGENILTLTAETSEGTGTYVFDYFELEIGRSLIIHCDWLDVPEVEEDLARLPICFVHHKPVSVELKPPPNGALMAGVTQHIEFEIFYGTGRSGNDGKSVLQLTCCAGSDLEFWDISRSKWSEICNYSLDRVPPGNKEIITVYLCKVLRNLSSNEENVKNRLPTFAAQILVKWMDKEWTFTVNFVSFMNIGNDTSLLEERVLFELAIFRNIDEWLIMPQEAILSRISDESLEIPAKLLNPELKQIEPGCKYRLVWILPLSKQKTDEIEHYKLRFTYRVKSLNGCSSDQELIYDREYILFDEFPIQFKAPNYELCAQLLSSQPGAVLCRVEDACDMIVSLRSLTNRVETVVVGIDADPCFWTINERHKLLHVKESGLGQISFTIFPKMIGFLPYPLISVYAYGHKRSNSDVSRSSTESICDFGPRLSSFVRTNGKQVHVLGAFATSTDSKSAVSIKTSRLKEAKSRITKLFD
uniref:Trafficking protein particle complex subunit 10 n=1 Tax=Elaeophora elaphi TaxID=1147741 RepID=A0A0R3RIZ3_9BILA